MAQAHVDVEDSRFEAAPSSFGVARAMNAEIPLLVASYALANRQARVLPAGYERRGEVRASVEDRLSETGARSSAPLFRIAITAGIPAGSQPSSSQ